MSIFLLCKGNMAHFLLGRNETYHQLALKWVTALVQALAECAPVPKFVVGPAVSQSGIDCWSWSFPAILKPRRREMFCFDEIDNTHALTNG